MALANLISADIGADTPHGVANGKIMKGLHDWIEAHRAEVASYARAGRMAQALTQAGVEPGDRVAAQIDKLSDAQLRDIARELDPELKP